MMIHVHQRSSLSGEEFPKRLAADWTSAALYFYSNYYNMAVEHTRDERDLLNQWSRQLYAATPDNLREGVHLLRKCAGSMGEDVYMVDGRLQHTLHCKHASCGAFELLRRGKKFWCAKCGVEAEDKDVRNWDEG